MSRPLIVMGDRTTHGGTVISADLTFDIHGKPVARVGDMTVCPKCKGTFAITSGADDLVDMNANAYARHLDFTACGARLISSQITTIWLDESQADEGAAGAEANAVVATSLVASSTNSGVCLDCLIAASSIGSTTVVRD